MKRQAKCKIELLNIVLRGKNLKDTQMHFRRKRGYRKGEDK